MKEQAKKPPADVLKAGRYVYIRSAGSNAGLNTDKTGGAGGSAPFPTLGTPTR